MEGFGYIKSGNGNERNQGKSDISCYLPQRKRDNALLQRQGHNGFIPL